MFAGTVTAQSVTACARSGAAPATTPQQTTTAPRAIPARIHAPARPVTGRVSPLGGSRASAADTSPARPHPLDSARVSSPAPLDEEGPLAPDHDRPGTLHRACAVRDGTGRQGGAGQGPE